MQRRIRTLLPAQFGLLELFMLTTVAAIAAAIFRLPYWRPVKVLLLLTLWGVFSVWVAKTSPPGPTRQVRVALMNSVGSLIQVTPLYADIFFRRSNLPWHIELLFVLLFVGLFGMHAALVVWQVRSALHAQPAQV